MGELTLWKQQEIEKLKKDMDRLFRQFRKKFGIPRSLVEAGEPFTVEVSETEGAVSVTARLSGIEPGDLEVSATEDTVTLKARTTREGVETGDGYRRVETASRTFSRTVSLPCRVLAEEAGASYKDGILHIRLPKCKPREARCVKIDIG